MSHDSQVANAPLRIVFPCHPAERWDNKAHCRRALSQPSRQRPVQPAPLFRNPFTQPACASRPQPAAKPRTFPLSPLYSAPKGRHLNPHAKGLSNLRPFSATLLHNLPAPAGHNLRRSRAPFPFIFSARRAPPSPLNPLNQPATGGPNLLHPVGFAAPIKKHPLSRVLFIDGFLREISLRTVPAWCLQQLQYR